MSRLAERGWNPGSFSCVWTLLWGICFATVIFVGPAAARQVEDIELRLAAQKKPAQSERVYIECDQSISGSLTDTDSRIFGGEWFTDRYYFTVPETMCVEFTMETEGFVPYLWVGKAEGGPGLFEGPWATQSSVLGPGEYAVIASSNAVLPDGSHPYALSMVCFSAPTIELGEAIEGDLGWNHPHIFNFATLANPYVFNLETRSSLEFTVKTEDFLPHIFVYQIGSRESFSDGLPPHEVTLEPGEYYALVSASSGSGAYRLTMTSCKTPPPQVPIPFQVYGEGTLHGVAVSPNGKQMISSSDSGWAALWDIETGEIVRRFFLSTAGVWSVAFTPDSKKVLTGTAEGSVQLWAVETGTVVRTFEGHTNLVLSIAVSPDGSHVLTGSQDGKAILWDFRTGEAIRTFNGHSLAVQSVDFSPDGTRVLTGSYDNTAILWDVETGAKIHTFQGHSNWVYGAVFSPDGQTILTGSADQTARLWDAQTGDSLRALEGHSHVIESAVFSPDGKQILTASLDETAKLWDAQTCEEIRTYPHVKPVVSARFLPDGRTFITTSSHDTIALWDVETGNKIRSFPGHSALVTSAAFSPDGTKTLSGSWDGNARLWDTETGRLLHVLEAPDPITSWVFSVAFSPDGTRLLTGSRDKVARLWDAETGQLIRTFSGHEEVVHSVAFSPDGMQILTGSADHTAKLWDMTTGDEIRTFIGHSDTIRTAVFSPNGETILTAGTDNQVRLWNSEAGEDLLTLANHDEEILTATFSPDGQKILTGSRNGTVRLWDSQSGVELATFAGHSGAIPSVAFSPDGTKIATADSHGLLLGVDDITSILTGFFSNIFTEGLDDSIRLWDLETGQRLLRIGGRKGGINSVAFSPDGRRILSGEMNGTSILWEIDSPRVLIVAGGGDYEGNALVEQTKALAAYAYSVCLARGYEKDDIRWLSAFEEEQDVDGDGIRDVFGPANTKTLREAIEWAKDDLVSPGRRFLIYMIDHGYPMTDEEGQSDLYFMLNPRETLSASELDTWLDSLTTDEMDIDMTLVVDSCYSGKFIEKCTPPEGEQRLVISSTTADTEAVMMPPPDLTSFSYVFWGAAYMGATMEEAVKAADGFFREFSSAGQRPQMDDNGDGIFNELDGNEMGQHRFGRSWAYAGHGTGEFPAFEEIHPSDDEFLTVQPGSSVDLSATIVPGSDPLEVWAVVRPPAPEIHAGEAVASDQTFKRINLNQDGKTWAGKLENLTEEGVYIVSYTARFPYQRLSRPKITRFRVSEKPNPEEVLTIRALLVAGGGTVRPFAQDMVSHALDVCQKRGYRTEDIRILGRDFPATVDEFQNALSTLSVPESDDKKLRLFIYLVGGCSAEGDFIFDNNEVLPAADLISQMNQLQNQHPLLDVILVVDAPHAGTFVEANADSPSNRRVAIAGTSTEGKGLFTQGLSQMSFSKYFLGNAYQGKDLWTSYDGAYLQLVDHVGQAEPLLDDDGDGETTKDDGLLAEQWYIGRRGALAGPGAASLPTLLAAAEFEEPISGDIDVWVDVLEAALPERVFVTIVPHSERGTTLASFPEIDLVRDEDTWRWSGIIPADLFAQSGNYTLVFYALYSDGKLSEPLATPLVYDSGTRVEDWSLF